MDSFNQKESEHILLHPQVLILIPLFTSTFLSLFNSTFLTFSISLITYYVYSFLRANHLLSKFKCSIRHKTTGKEEDPFQINYKFRNIDYSTISNVNICDNFEGYVNYKNSTFYHYELDSKLKKRDFSLDRKISLNNGMGKKKAGPFQIYGWDNSGLFEFTLENQRAREIEVFPKVNPTKVPKEKENPEQKSFGKQSNPLKGSNTNFYCTKEYIPGDNTKHINWKLTLKNQKPILNVFEKNTNSNLTCILIDDIRIHYGKGKFSSFENCKDLLLSFVHAQINRNNEIGFISLQKCIKKNFTRDHLKYLEVLFSNFEPIPINSLSHSHRKSTISEVQKLKFNILQNNSIEDEIFIFTSFLKGKIWGQYENLILNLAKMGYKVTVVLVYGTKYEIESIKSQEHLSRFSPLIHSKSVLEDICSRLKKFGINTYLYELNNLDNNKMKVYEVFKKPF